MHEDWRRNSCQTAVSIECQADGLSLMNLLVVNGEFHSSVYIVNGGSVWCVMYWYEKMKHFMHNFDDVIMSQYNSILRKNIKWMQSWEVMSFSACLFCLCSFPVNVNKIWYKNLTLNGYQIILCLMLAQHWSRILK
jgi:hypothetical protein